MSEVTMSIHEGLAKLKLYNQKIGQLVSSPPPMISLMRNKDPAVLGKTKEQFTKEAEAYLNSFESLLENKALLKSAVVKSNAETKIIVAGKTYSVADAIERKNSMAILLNLTQKLIRQVDQETKRMEDANNRFQSDFERYLTSMGAESTNKRKPEEIELLREMFTNNNGSTLYDPLKLSEHIAIYTNIYESFVTEIDFRLSESNALTKITVNFV